LTCFDFFGFDCIPAKTESDEPNAECLAGHRLRERGWAMKFVKELRRRLKDDKVKARMATQLRLENDDVGGSGKDWAWAIGEQRRMRFVQYPKYDTMSKNIPFKADPFRHTRS